MIGQENLESTDLHQGSSLPQYCPDSRFESQHGDPDCPRNSINYSLYHYRDIRNISSEYAQNLLSNDWFCYSLVSMVILFTNRI